jgi:hypothetical protein
MEGTQTATVELLTDFVHLTPTPAAVHAGQMVHFQMALDDGTPATVWQWSWTKDPGSNANPLSGCANAYDFCNGTVWGPGTLSGRTDYGWASAHVIVYSNFTLDADRASVHVGDTVRFTPKYDGAPGPAARWRWAPAAGSNDSTACANGVSPCKKAMLASGTMWAYTSTTPGQGDSASAAVTVVPGRITLTGGGVFRPGDVATFTAGSTVGALVVTGWEWRPPTGGNGNRLPLGNVSFLVEIQAMPRGVAAHAAADFVGGSLV